MFESVDPAIIPLVVALALISLNTLGWHAVKKSRSARNDYAPIVQIDAEDIFRNPRKAYEGALKKYGHVIGVRRKGRLEYIVDDEVAYNVLTSDDSFSFEEGTATILNFHYVYRFFGTFFEDLDDLVRRGIAARLPTITDQIFPVFAKHIGDAVKSTHSTEAKMSESGGRVNIFDVAQKAISEAMTLTILGQRFVSEKNLVLVEQVADELASVMGLYTNTSFWARTLPDLWRVFTWTRVFFSTILPFYRVIGLQVWKEMREYHHEFHGAPKFGDDEKDENVLQYLIRKDFKSRPAGDRGIVYDTIATLRIVGLVLGIIFASVHQTASVIVWIVFEIASRPEYLPGLREELLQSATVDPIDKHPSATYETLQNARYIDSFIREVLRTKGDTLSLCRQTTRDVAVGNRTVPKGFVVVPMATLAHMSPKYHGADASEFKGDRWVSTDRQAVKLSASYFPFGLGRWACPGRALAVAEIKMVVWSIICRATPVLEGNAYQIVDPLNITSVPPEGKLSLIPFDG